MRKHNVLVIGGAGYIGSHTILELLENGHTVVAVDKVGDSNFNGRLEALKTVARLSGIELGSDKFKFYNGELGSNKFKLFPNLQTVGMGKLARENKIDLCIDFAAFSEAETSMREPEKYFINNSVNFFCFVPVLYSAGVQTIVKSSTAAVYSNMDPGMKGFDEDAVLTKIEKSSLDAAETKKGVKQGEELHQYLMGLTTESFRSDGGLLENIMSKEVQTRLKQPVNVYGWSKVLNEVVLEYFAKKFSRNYCILRYFNAWGVHHSGNLLEDHKPETHLLPRSMDCIINYEKRAYKSRSILKRNEFLLLFGTKFPTKDGTCIRDYIHVVDLAKAHVNALEKKGTYNLAIGKGFSNRDMLKCIVEGAGVELVILSRADEGKIYKIKVKSETPYEIDIIDHSLLKERALYVVEWEKRVGDAPKLIANPDQAKKSLNWCATITPYDKKCMEDVYLSRKKNPGGYDS